MSLCKLQTYVTQVVDNKQISARDLCKFKWISVRVYYDTHLIDFCYTPEYTGSMQDVPQLLNDMLSSSDQSMKEIRQVNALSAGITRRAYLVVQSEAKAFALDSTKRTWIAMPGLRGIGKTTILSQVYGDPALNEVKKIYASFDRVKTVGASIQDFITACETYYGSSFESINEPIALFLDEVQYLDDWAVGLKTVLDRSKNIFIFCTGSSALSLQTDANVARRMSIIKLHPLCFTEYVMIKQSHEGESIVTKPVTGLTQQLKTAIFGSSSANDAYNKLSTLKPLVNEYWNSIPYPKNSLFGEYLAHGTLPFTLDLPNKSAIWDRINRILSESLDRDVMSYNRFDNETVTAIPRLLFLLASSVEISITKLTGTLELNKKTVMAVLAALEKTEIITAIPPKGAHRGRIGKPNKYMFTSPAMRAALCNFGGIITPDNDTSLRGKLLEDIVGLYLKRIFLEAPLTRAIVEYDPAQGGADFIVSPDGTNKNAVVLEVGAQKDNSKQVIQTLASIDGRYGAVVTSGTLEVDKENNVLRIPFEFFFLL